MQLNAHMLEVHSFSQTFLVIAKAFQAKANEETAEIRADEAEGVVLSLLQHPLPEDLLDTIIKVTEGELHFCNAL